MAIWYQNEMGTVVNLDLVVCFYVNDKLPFNVMAETLNGRDVVIMTTPCRDRLGALKKLDMIMSRIQHGLQCPVYMDPVHDHAVMKP